MSDVLHRLRNLAGCVATVSLAALAGSAPAAFAATQTLEAEAFSLASTAGQPYSDAAASGGRGLLMWSNGTASKSFTTAASGRLAIRARGDQCGGAPRMVLRVDGTQVLAASVSATGFTTYSSSTQVGRRQPPADRQLRQRLSQQVLRPQPPGRPGGDNHRGPDAGTDRHSDADAHPDADAHCDRHPGSFVDGRRHGHRRGVDLQPAGGRQALRRPLQRRQEAGRRLALDAAG